MPKGIPSRSFRCGVKPIENASCGHPVKYRYDEEAPICGSSLVDLEAKLAAFDKQLAENNEATQPEVS